MICEIASLIIVVSTQVCDSLIDGPRMLKIKVVIGDTYIRQFSYNISQSFSRAASVLNGALAKRQDKRSNRKYESQTKNYVSYFHMSLPKCLVPTVYFAVSPRYAAPLIRDTSTDPRITATDATPCASMIASMQPSRHDARSSSARRRVISGRRRGSGIADYRRRPSYTIFSTTSLTRIRPGPGLL
jgi:hypothetical protein